MKNKYTEVEKLEHARSIIDKKITAVQNSCKHPIDHVKSKNGANTGNYDPHSDRYWVDHRCDICHKWWREDLTYDNKDYDDNVILWLLQYGYASTIRQLNGQGYYLKES
jgi:hypothetical protein